MLCPVAEKPGKHSTYELIVQFQGNILILLKKSKTMQAWYHNKNLTNLLWAMISHHSETSFILET